MEAPLPIPADTFLLHRHRLLKWALACGSMSSLSLSLPLVSPLVTRVLELRGFSPQLQTRDLHALLSPATLGDESAYKIKWRDDTCAYVIFQDASLAKRAYLQLLCAPPPLMQQDPSANAPKTCARLTSTSYAAVRPCTGPEAASLLGSGAAPHAPGAQSSRVRASWGDPPPIGSRHFSHERPHRRVPSNAPLPNKPIGSLDASALARTPALPDVSGRSPSGHTRFPSSGMVAHDTTSALRMM